MTGNGREVGAVRDAAVVAETDTRRNTRTASQTEGERKFPPPMLTPLPHEPPIPPNIQF